MRRMIVLALVVVAYAPIAVRLKADTTAVRVKPDVTRAQRPAVSSKPDTPFKLATFDAGAKTHLGVVLGNRVIDIDAANAELTRTNGLTAVRIPDEMRVLIEEYARVSPRLYQ